MKPHMHTAFRRALLAAFGCTAIASSAFAEDSTVSLTEDFSSEFSCTISNLESWLPTFTDQVWSNSDSDVAAFPYSFYYSKEASTRTYTSETKNAYSITFTKGVKSVFFNEKSDTGFDAFVFSGLKNVTFADNQAVDHDMMKSYTQGMAISTNGGNIVLKDNTAVTFDRNISHANGGGAINTSSGNIALTGNSSVSFTGNEASNGAGGGAIRNAGSGTNTTLANNGSVSFVSNAVNGSGSYAGAAIFSYGDVTIANNQDVTFSGNIVKGESTNGIYLNSIQLSGNTPGTLNLSAKEDGDITFYDTVKTNGNVELNKAYDHDGDASTDAIAQTGTITFSAAHVEEDLAAYITDLSDDDKAAAILASCTNTIEGSVTLHAGTLALEDEVIMNITGGLVVKSGATLSVSLTDENTSVDATTLNLSDVTAVQNSAVTATLNADLTLADNATLSLEYGCLDMGGNNVTLGSEVLIEVVLDSVANLDDSTVTLFANLGSTVDLTSAEIIFTDGVIAKSGDIVNNGDGTITVTNTKMIPEPTTATLSLLALAALAVRRRRR